MDQSPTQLVQVLLFGTDALCMPDAQPYKVSTLDGLILFGDTTAEVLGADACATIWCCCIVLLPFGAAVLMLFGAVDLNCIMQA
ncbi:hypothetical protein U1Q18_037352 [Sarracenia purpurea var. burkii]